MSRRIPSALLVLAVAGCATPAIAAEPLPTIRLWPGAAPGSEGLEITETITERSTDPAAHDRITRGITEPSLRMHAPATSNGTAVIVAPGGAYERVVIDKEGLDTAAWLNGLGITAFVLTYRLPDEGHADGYLVPVQDAQRAVRVVRAHAAAWGLDPARIGFLGYSAGGHVAMAVSFHAARRTYAPVDSADELDARPDFTIYGYAVSGPFGSQAADPAAPQRTRLLTEFLVRIEPGESHPPAFILHADDDSSVNPDHAVRIYTALCQAGVAAELHIFRRGGHGFGIRNARGPIARWPDVCEAWLRDIGMLP